ncbi:hypothetical protein ACFL4H_01025 [Candidatus Neomarinimicrobiota bacterium]
MIVQATQQHSIFVQAKGHQLEAIFVFLRELLGKNGDKKNGFIEVMLKFNAIKYQSILNENEIAINNIQVKK